MGRKRADSFFDPRSPHSRDVDEVCADLRVKPDVGLKSEEIEFRRQDAGWNELDQEEKTPLWELVLEQFDDPLVKVLLLAAGISFAIGLADGDHWTHALVEPSVIIAILIINAIVGVWQESNAENALEALKSLQAQHAVVLRDGHTQEIESRELVPGDIVFVKAGDKVPADCRVLELLTTTLRVEQAALTGESETAMKDVHAVEVDTDITGKTNMLFSSTSITNGKAKALVVSIGMETEIGTIQASVQAVEDGDTPLKKKLDKFGDLLQKVIFWICVLVWMMKLPLILEGETWGDCGMRALYYLKIAVSLAVAAIPEGLPAVITTCLALGTRRMARRNAIIRKLPSVETLGSTTVICSDKTGTLTTNEMSVVRIATFDEDDLLRVREVTGVSYEPIGDVMDFSELREEDKALLNFQKVCTLCNDSRIEWDEEGKIKRIGEPTEAAMKVVAEKLGVLGGSRNVEEITAVSDHWTAQFKRLATLEFSRDRKSMSVLCRGEEDSSNSLFVKGAPESVLARCDSVMMADGRLVTMDDQVKAEIQAVQAQMAGNALRTLACAVKTDGLGDLENYDGPDHKAHVLLVKPDTFAEIESDLTFVGMVGIIDPPRPEVRASIRDCHDAGVRVIVITGDNKNTAEAICRKIGVFDDSEDISEQSFIGREFMLKSEKEQLEILGHKSRGLVFSRSEPKHKLQLVTMLQSLNEVVAMTGDGVNDAPALKGADIGIAMGIAGTEVAKEASAMVLADDNFATIVAAVEEGRSIFNNTKAFIRYLISSNIGEVASIFITAAIGVPEGLLPVQLLWVNLVTDGPPATALGFNPPEKDVMKKPPRKTDEDLISGWVFFRYMVVGIYVGLATVAVFVFWFCFYDAEDGHPLVTFQQLRSFDKCDVNAPEWQDFAANINSYMAGMNGTASFALEPINNPCDWFEEGKVKASTMSLSVLVAIEMFNALNALSEDGSLLTMPPWANPWLLVAMAVSFILHFGILAIPACNGVFSVVNLTQQDWIVVIAFSAPVVLVDEVLKFVGRMRTRMARRRRKLE